MGGVGGEGGRREERKGSEEEEEWFYLSLPLVPRLLHCGKRL